MHCSHAALLALGATVPAAHGVGSDAPSEQALPTGHAWQPSCDTSAVALPNEPASHGLTTAAPAAQYPPCVQTLQAVLPSTSWKVPAAQMEHALAPDVLLKEPVAHACGEVDPAAQDAPAGHSEQSACLVLPSAAE